MSKSLPQELQNFLDVTNLEFTHVYQPSWIKGSMYGDSLTIDFGSGQQDEGNERRTEFCLNRKLFLAQNSKHQDTSRIENDLLLLLLSYVDGAIAVSRAKGGVVQFWSTACHLAESWVGSQSEARFDRGLADLDSDAIIEYLESYKSLGIEGVLGLCQHWEMLISRALNKMGDNDSFHREQSPVSDTEIRIGRCLGRAGDFGIKQVELSYLERVVRFLISENAYDALGNVKTTYAAKLLNIPSKRVACNVRFRFYLRRFSLAEDFLRSDFPLYGMRSEPNHLRKRVEQRVEQTGNYKIDDKIRALRHISKAAKNIPTLAGSDLANEALLEELILAIERPDGGRTPSLPVSTALQFIRKSVSWILEVGPQLESVTEQICRELGARRISGRRAFYLEMSDILTEIDSDFLRGFAVTSFWGRGRRCDPNWGVPTTMLSGDLGYSDILDLHFAICSSMVLLMACLRKGEYFDIADEHVDSNTVLPYLLCGLRKRGIDGVRPTKRKPIPRIAQMALTSQINLRKTWAAVTETVHGGGNHVLWRLTESGVSGSMDSAALYKALDMMSEYFDLRAPNGRRWYIRPHQLRRCFALTFFHSGEIENVLPALSWFMGHRTIAETWRYVQEQLTGSEISTAEAQMATLAVLSPTKAEAVESLRSILRVHFQCEDLLVMDEEEVQGYLEYLHHEGVYTASPIDIRTAGGRRVSIFISIRKVQ